MEITSMTFITLTILCILALYGICWLFKILGEHDKVKYSTLNKPLKNAGKPWYNK